MAVPAALVIVPIGMLFILSGLLVNLVQAFFYVLIRPLSKKTYRKINKVVVELLLLELIWLFDWWAGIKVELYMDSQTFEMMGKEHALLICNHRSDIDWLVGWVIAQRAGCLGSALAIMKKEAKFLPVVGWSMWFSDYVFVDRCWAKDENTLKVSKGSVISQCHSGWPYLWRELGSRRQSSKQLKNMLPPEGCLFLGTSCFLELRALFQQ